MSIDPNVQYDAFTFIAPNEEIEWTIPGPLPGDLVAGLLVALDIIIDEMVEATLTKHELKRVEIISGLDKIMIYMSDPEGLFEGFQNYRIDSSIDVPRDMNLMRDDTRNFPRYDRHVTSPRPNEFGLWIVDEVVRINGRYVLYSFQRADFIQGFISMCNAFDVDYAAYLYGSPFTFDPTTRQIAYYDIQL